MATKLFSAAEVQAALASAKSALEAGEISGELARRWKERGDRPEVIARLDAALDGVVDGTDGIAPWAALVCWVGELLREGYQEPEDYDEEFGDPNEPQFAHVEHAEAYYRAFVRKYRG
jgi:hypothetical protein